MPGYNDLLTRYPEIADQWHPFENGDLMPDEVLSGTHRKVWWLCEKGHKWRASVVGRTGANHGCRICTNKEVLSGYNDLLTKNCEVAAQWHPVLNGHLTPKDVLGTSGAHAHWLCELGHAWVARINERTGRDRTGCPTCSNYRLLLGFNDLLFRYPEVAAQWHPTLNGSLLPIDFVFGSLRKVWWLCEKGHKWEARIVSRTSKNQSGCPHCAASNASVIEQTLRELVKDTGLLADVNSNGIMRTYIPSLKTDRQLDISGKFLAQDGSVVRVIIEYDGKRYHDSKIANDVRNTAAFIEDGYRVIRIREGKGKSGLQMMPMTDPFLLQISFRHTKDVSKMLVLLEEIRTWLEVRCAEIGHEAQSAALQSVIKLAQQAAPSYKSVANKTK